MTPERVVRDIAADAAAVVANLRWWLNDPELTITENLPRITFSVWVIEELAVGLTGRSLSQEHTARVLGIHRNSVRRAIAELSEMSGSPSMPAAIGSRHLTLACET